MKKVRKTLLIIFCAVIALAALGILVLICTEYRPKDQEAAETSLHKTRTLSVKDSIRILSWNTGYGGLDESVDFFMDGGEMTFPASQAVVNQNIDAISDFLVDNQSDICLLQEVDLNSSRTKHLDELKLYTEITGLDYSYAPNYRCLFVPFPLPPLGQMESGIVTMSSCRRQDSSLRVSLPNPFSWPVRIANLKRCLLVDRFPLEGSDRELVMINVHLDAYDSGEGRVAQTKALLAFMKEEYEKGNYCVAGGDFNQLFPDTEEMYPIKNPELWVPGELDTKLLEDGWQYFFDALVPSCRLLNQPYDPEDEGTQYYVIDGFVVSPNVVVDRVKTVNLEFANSDHNPVEVVVRLE